MEQQLEAELQPPRAAHFWKEKLHLVKSTNRPKHDQIQSFCSFFSLFASICLLLSPLQLFVGPGNWKAEGRVHQPHWRLHVAGSLSRREDLHLWSLRLSGQAVGPEGRVLQADLQWTHQRHQCHCCEDPTNHHKLEMRVTFTTGSRRIS